MATPVRALVSAFMFMTAIVCGLVVILADDFSAAIAFMMFFCAAFVLAGLLVLEDRS